MLNVLCFFLPGKVWADETLSARLHRTKQYRINDVLRVLINFVFFWQKDHCLSAYESEKYRKQISKDYGKCYE